MRNYSERRHSRVVTSNVVAQKLAEMLTEGNVSMLIRKLVEEKYEELFGKKTQQGGD